METLPAETTFQGPSITQEVASFLLWPQCDLERTVLAESTGVRGVWSLTILLAALIIQHHSFYIHFSSQGYISLSRVSC